MPSGGIQMHLQCLRSLPGVSGMGEALATQYLGSDLPKPRFCSFLLVDYYRHWTGTVWISTGPRNRGKTGSDSAEKHCTKRQSHAKLMLIMVS